MPAGKLEKLRLVIEQIKRKDVVSRQKLQRLLGLLNHWSEVIRAGRIFMNRLLRGFKHMSQSQDYFEPSEGFRKDLIWWERIAPHLNYVAMMNVTQITPEGNIEMDASTSWGIGAVNHISKEFFLIPSPSVIADLPIHCGEMSALMLVVDAWSGQRSNPQSQHEG